jgi:Adenylate and Guanylate cyclase catalytic domain
LLGDGVNIAARLESLAPEGGICISRSVHEAVANKLSVEFSDKGKQNLKNIPEPVHAYTFASEVTSPKRMRAAHLPPRYWGGIAALSMLAVGIFGFMFSARQDSESPNK